ncbi:MAG: GatB/YqeY domain-containing protein [Patescibacteria group bacterium]
MLSQKINQDLKEAFKGKDDFRVGVLRLIISALRNKEIEKKGKEEEKELSDEETIEILGKEAKKRKEAAEIYNKGGRNDLAEKEKRELEIIKKYLPEQLSEVEVEKIVKAVIEKVDVSASGGKEFGIIIGEAMKELKGKADGKLVGEIIKRLLA